MNSKELAAIARRTASKLHIKLTPNNKGSVDGPTIDATLLGLSSRELGALAAITRGVCALCPLGFVCPGPELAFDGRDIGSPKTLHASVRGDFFYNTTLYIPQRQKIAPEMAARIKQEGLCQKSDQGYRRLFVGLAHRIIRKYPFN